MARIDGEAPVRILLVEDNTEDAAMFARELGACVRPKFEVAHAQSLACALAFALRDGHSAVVLDLSLPDLDGFAGLRQLASSLPHAAIVVLAGLDRESAAVEAIRYGAQEFLSKGKADPARLARSVRMALERKRFEARLVERANFDSLTGLANRTLFHDRLTHALARARRARERVGLLYIDLDGFKEVNDTLGHAAGDEVLRGVAVRFRAAVRQSETVARLGGDEFAILLEPLADAEAAVTVAERVLAALRAPLPVAGTDVCITPSIGAAIFPDQAGEPEALLRAADAAMFRAKRAGKNRRDSS